MDGGLVAVLTVAATALGCLGTWLLNAFKQRAESRRVERKDTLDEMWKYVAELRAQNERQAAVIEQHTRAVEAFARENADCREENAEQRQSIHFLYDHLRRCFVTLKTECGQDPGELPELPALRPRSAGAGAEFLGRQAQQSAQLLREAGETIRPPGGPAAPPPVQPPAQPPEPPR